MGASVAERRARFESGYALDEPPFPDGLYCEQLGLKDWSASFLQVAEAWAAA
jgi:hypothetical protein